MNNINYDSLKPGLSGIMRVRNEEALISACIDSVIESLDELIVVCNDCTDSTPLILEQKQKKYGTDKLRIFFYNHNVLSFDLNKEEYDLALSLPLSSPRLYCNQCNYGIKKARYKYAVKIDTDQIYFHNELKKWRDLCANETSSMTFIDNIKGACFSAYFSIYRRLSAKLKKPQLWMIPNWFIHSIYSSYRKYAEHKLIKGHGLIALSGVNVFKDNNDWVITMDHINTHPPYNGEGDTVIFKLSPKTFFTRTSSSNGSYSVTERFSNPSKMYFSEPVWFHLHALRKHCRAKVALTKKENPELFIDIPNFCKLSYNDLLRLSSPQVPTVYQKTLFAFIHSISSNNILSNIQILDNYAHKL